ncbi:MAG TPA: PA0069 family radical SAM protein [Blastocatellia bacterium]|jgi:DNA repair photolyase|nr:PA0069 family radical SAM protein [Blastocatellia bacterium]
MQPSKPIAIRGRGAVDNPPNRFERLAYLSDPELTDHLDETAPALRTQFLKDASRSIIAYNDSPDVGFNASVNPYRGCEHGCIYCYARPTHEYLGFSAGLDFETRVLVKEDAPELLRKELASPKWKPQVIAMSGVTDCYQPIERKLQLTRRCLEVFAEFRNPVAIVTKNHLVTRDADILADMARDNTAGVCVSVTTLDADLARVMEPRTSKPADRIEAIEALSKAGIPTGVMVGPVIPGLTDHELISIVSAAANAGARFAGYIVVRLPYGVKELFDTWLQEHFPDRRKKVLSHILDVRGGKLNDPRFKSRMKGEGVYSDQIQSMFKLACRKAGITGRHPQLSTDAFRRPPNRESPQLSLFN